jgi:hypothetical protein
MNIIKYLDDIVKKWDKKVRNLLSYKLNENQYISCVHWYLLNNKYEYNLFTLNDHKKSIWSQAS